MSEINTTPLADVMLVLLIIFIITAPLLTHAVKVDLPRASTQASPDKPETITLSVDGEGAMFWNTEPVEEASLAAKPDCRKSCRGKALTSGQAVLRRVAEAIAAATMKTMNHTRAHSAMDRPRNVHVTLAQSPSPLNTLGSTAESGKDSSI
jgi:biopolymer transport protein ExbD